MKKSNTYTALLIERLLVENEPYYKLCFSPIDIDKNNSLEELYKYLKCDCIDIQERVINGKVYDFIFDDEYLINGKSEDTRNAVAIGTDQNGKMLEIIFGNLIICGQADQEGAETSLNDEDISNLLDARQMVENIKHKAHFEMMLYKFE